MATIIQEPSANSDTCGPGGVQVALMTGHQRFVLIVALSFSLSGVEEDLTAAGLDGGALRSLRTQLSLFDLLNVLEGLLLNVP